MKISSYVLTLTLLTQLPNEVVALGQDLASRSIGLIKSYDPLRPKISEVATLDELKGVLSTWKTKVKIADIVFHGKVKKVDIRDTIRNGGGLGVQFRFITFDIITLLKGNWEKGTFTLGCALGDSSLPHQTLDFPEGEEVILFAGDSKQFTENTPHWCSIQDIYHVNQEELVIDRQSGEIMPLLLTENFFLEPLARYPADEGGYRWRTGKRVRADLFKEAFSSVHPLRGAKKPVEADPATFDFSYEVEIVTFDEK